MHILYWLYQQPYCSAMFLKSLQSTFSPSFFSPPPPAQLPGWCKGRTHWFVVPCTEVDWVVPIGCYSASGLILLQEKKSEFHPPFPACNSLLYQAPNSLETFSNFLSYTFSLPCQTWFWYCPLSLRVIRDRHRIAPLVKETGYKYTRRCLAKSHNFFWSQDWQRQ